MGNPAISRSSKGGNAISPMYVAEISLAAKIQSDALAKHYLYPRVFAAIKISRLPIFARARARARESKR